MRSGGFGWVEAKRACHARLDRLEERLARVAEIQTDTSQYLPLKEAEIAPVAARSRPLTSPGAMISLVAGELSLGGRKMGVAGEGQAREQLRQDLHTLRRNWTILHPTPADTPFLAYIVAGSDESAADLLAVAGVLHEEAITASLVVRVADPPALPNALPEGASEELEKTVAEFRSTPNQEKAQALADIMSNAIGSCVPLRRHYGRVADAEPGRKPEVLLAGVVPALRECHCWSVDIDTLEASLVLVLVPEGLRVGWLPLVSGALDAGALQRVFAQTKTAADVAHLLELAEPSL